MANKQRGGRYAEKEAAKIFQGRYRRGKHDTKEEGHDAKEEAPN